MRRIPTQAWLLALLSGVFQVLIFPSPSLYFLSWVALAPLLLAILRNESGNGEVLDAAGESLSALSTGQAFWLGYACGVIWYLGSCYWIFNTMNVYGIRGRSWPGSWCCSRCTSGCITEHSRHCWRR